MIEKYFIEVNPENLPAEVFAEHFGLKLDKYDSNELQIVCSHMTTASKDDLHSFLDYGLLDLRTMLQKDTPLSRFLLQHEIKVYVDKHKININGKEYPILGSGEICPNCYNGRDRVCTGYFRCDSFKALMGLASKLYFYQATVEFFINASLDKMKSYSTLDRYPEILNTLDDIISAINGQFSKTYTLSNDWVTNDRNCYVLQYPCQLSKIETFAPLDYRESFRNYEILLHSCSYNFADYMKQAIPKRVYDNIAFLRRFLSIYFYNSDEYGSLLADGCISPDNIRIFQVTGDKPVPL